MTEIRKKNMRGFKVVGLSSALGPVMDILSNSFAKKRSGLITYKFENEIKFGLTTQRNRIYNGVVLFFNYSEQ